MELMTPISNKILKEIYLLQSPNIDILFATQSVNSLKNILLNIRNVEEEFKIIFPNTEKMCEVHKIRIPEVKKIKSQLKLISLLQIKDFIVLNMKNLKILYITYYSMISFLEYIRDSNKIQLTL
jgi:hypothetical protein